MPPRGADKWFYDLFGFIEEDYATTQAQLRISDDGRTLTSAANGKSYAVGEFSTPSLGELIERGAPAYRALLPGAGGDDGGPPRRLRLRTVVGDVSDLHGERKHRHATFQVVSICALAA